MKTLKKTEIFRDLSDQDLENLSMTMINRVYPAGVTILREGTRGNTMFVIKSGQVEIKKRNPELGVDLTITKLGAGSIFGEMALLTGAARSATVASITPIELLILKKKDFDALVMEYPHISVLINTMVNERLASMNGQFSK